MFIKNYMEPDIVEIRLVHIDEKRRLLSALMIAHQHLKSEETKDLISQIIKELE